ncbi:DUF255 domain-containing protein [Chryseobacterium sp. SNU WT5]|uniref:thioredoxin family protein n=1 Tax=Chryseobacterium sp. SNU WT5 TaxID=2594269 RepID=UPI00117EB806|nr:thioredoxin family protein [Chryseobacterium sp. SNU WT5]QDP84589.1 DUF255 domain-containing protein [Chryseobacterium sp. SNU WT5]
MKYTKILLIAFLFCFMQNVFSQEAAEVVIENAQKKAKAENKNVLVFFHASWCGWCKKMEKKMTLPETQKLFNDNYVLASLDVLERGEKEKLENPNGEEWMAKYGGKTAGLPFFVFINGNGEVLENSFDANGDNLGCPSTTEEIAIFIAKLEKTSKLNKADLATIQKVFGEK